MSVNSSVEKNHGTVVVYDGTDIQQARRLISGIPVHEGIEHVQSGVHVTIFANGHMLLEGYGTPAHGDPFPGMEIRFDPIACTLRIQNKFIVRRNGDVSEYECQYGRCPSRSFTVNFMPGADESIADALAACDRGTAVSNAGTEQSGAETGRFTALHGANDTLHVEILDSGKLLHSAICIRYLCPVTGDAMRVVMDENTVNILRRRPDAPAEQAHVELTGDIFAPYDIRHQPAAKPA